MPAAKKTGVAGLLADLAKKHGTKIGTAADVLTAVNGLTTGNLGVDYATGVDGLPMGRLVELYGPPSSGKTTTALQCAAALQQQIIAKGLDEYILYLDYEQAIDKVYTAALGLDVDHDSFILAQPAYLEQGGEIANALMSKINVGLMIVDSVASMAPKALLDGEFDQRTSAMNRARLLNGWLIRLIGQLKEHDACAVFINHLTESINMTGPMAGRPTENTPGGKGLKYYASLRLKYQQVRNVPGEVDDALIGGGSKGHTSTIVKVKVTKNKVGPPFREAEVRVRFGKGFDNAWSALQVLIAHGSIRKNGAFYKLDLAKMPDLRHPDFWDSDDRAVDFHGADKILAFAETHPTWREALISHAVVLVRAYGGIGLETGDLSGSDIEQAGGVDEVPAEELL